MGSDTMVVEIPQWVSPPGSAADGGHIPQMSVGRDVGVPTHWVGTGNGVIGGDWGVYCLPPKHICTIHCDPSYHGLVFGSGEEAGNAPIQTMVVAACP